MNRFIYVGTYTQTGRGLAHRPEAIYQYRFDPADGALALLGAARDTLNPSFLAVHPTRRYLFAANELTEGQVSAFAIQARSGALAYLNSQPTRGAAPCYLTCDPSGRWLLAANYSTGSLTVHPIAADGRLGEMAAFIQHEGAGPDSSRQERPHAHSVRFDPTGRFVLAADLGIDQVLVYRLDESTGMLSLHHPPGARLEAGAGPRHFDFHPGGRFVYIANELNSTVMACAWDGQQGVLEKLQVLSTLPPGFTGENFVADIHLTPDGSFLYVSNRGHHSLAAFSVDRHTGLLNALGQSPSGGEWPRNFAIDPGGTFLVCANQNTDNLVVYRINSSDGSLTPTGPSISAPSPVCVLFVDL